MKRFILKVILFLLPVALYYAFPIAVIILSKEYYTVAHVVAIQDSNKNALYGNVYNTNASFIPYKQGLVDTNNPNVIVLGTSRVLEIRREFFNPQTNFINAGLPGGYTSVNDIKYFVSTMPNSPIDGHNRVLLLGLERELFTISPDQANATTENYLSFLGFHFYMPLNVSRGIYLDYFVRHEYSFLNLVRTANSTNDLGINAIAKGNGLRSDGSYRYNSASQDPNLAATNLAEIRNVALNIAETNKDSLVASDDQNIASNLVTLQQILAIAKARNITVIGFIPPYPIEINQATFASSSAYLDRETNLTGDISDDFKKAGFDFYDMSDITKYGGNDGEFVDTVHGSDLLYAKMSLYLAEHDPILSAYFDATALKSMIASSTGNFLPF